MWIILHLCIRYRWFMQMNIVSLLPAGHRYRFPLLIRMSEIAHWSTVSLRPRRRTWQRLWMGSCPLIGWATAWKVVWSGGDQPNPKRRYQPNSSYVNDDKLYLCSTIHTRIEARSGLQQINHIQQVLHIKRDRMNLKTWKVNVKYGWKKKHWRSPNSLIPWCDMWCTILCLWALNRDGNAHLDVFFQIFATLSWTWNHPCAPTAPKPL